VQAFGLVVAIFVLLIGCHTVWVGLRDGVMRQRIRSRWHRDERELTGSAAIWSGASVAFLGALVIGLGLWMAIKVM
jgi:hypothetical protein